MIPGAEEPLVLASSSPRRVELLRGLGIPCRVAPVPVDETPLPGEDPEAHVLRLAEAKALAGSARMEGALALGGDTVVVLDGEILGKPASSEEAVRMLLRLSGRAHEVRSGLAFARGGRVEASGSRVTRVFFRPFDPAEATAYVGTGEPMDKAGGYGIQGLGAALVEGIEGDWSNVVGLPIPLLLSLLGQVGRPWSFPGPAAAGPDPSMPDPVP